MSTTATCQGFIDSLATRSYFGVKLAKFCECGKFKMDLIFSEIHADCREFNDCRIVRRA